jgi:hypothetical protein
LLPKLCIVRKQRFRPDTSYREQDVLPSVRAPHEGAWCRERLATITALA